MWPSRRVARQAMDRWATLGLAALLWLGAGAGSVRAHALLVSSGEAVVHDDHVVVELEVVAEDFLHYYAPPQDESGSLAAIWDDLVERHGAALARALSLRDGQGSALAGRVVRVRRDWSDGEVLPPQELKRYRVYYTLRFEAAIPSRFVTFRMRPDAGWSNVLSQTVLAVRGVEDRQVALVRLTSRGNAETVEISRDGGAARVVNGASVGAAGSDCVTWEESGAARFREIFAEIGIGDGGVESRVVVPLPLLGTWIAPVQADPDSLSVSEQAAVRPAVQELLKSAMIAECDGAAVPVELSDVRFLPIEPQPVGTPQSRRSIDLWTGRVEARLHFAAPAQAGQITLRWALFNNAVLSARANVTLHGRCREHVFTTYDPAFTWRRG